MHSPNCFLFNQTGVALSLHRLKNVSLPPECGTLANRGWLEHAAADEAFGGQVLGVSGEVTVHELTEREPLMNADKR